MRLVNRNFRNKTRFGISFGVHYKGFAKYEVVPERFDVGKEKAKLRELSLGEGSIVCRYDYDHAAKTGADKRLPVYALMIGFAASVVATFALFISINHPELILPALLADAAALAVLLYPIRHFLSAKNYLYSIVERNGKTVLVRQKLDPIKTESFTDPKLIEERSDRMLVSCRETVLVVPKAYPRLEKYLKEGGRKEQPKELPPVRELADELEKGRKAKIYSSAEEFEERLREFFAEDGELSLSARSGEEWVELEKKDEKYLLSTRIGIVFVLAKDGQPDVTGAFEGLYAVRVGSFNLNEWRLDIDRLRRTVPEAAVDRRYIADTESMSLYDLVRASEDRS